MSSTVGGSTGFTFPDGTTQSTAGITAPSGSLGNLQYNNGTTLGGLASGTSGQVLTSSGASVPPGWTSQSGLAVGNLTGGVAGAIPYQTAPGTTGFTAAGVEGQYLQSTGTGAPVWGNPPGTMQKIASAGSGGGGLNTVEVSWSPTLYTQIYINVYRFIPDSGSAQLKCDINVSGLGWISSGWTSYQMFLNSASYSNNQNNQFVVGPNVSTLQPMSCNITLYAPNISHYVNASWQGSSGVPFFGGVNNNSYQAPIYGIRFYTSTGATMAFQASVYGWF